MNKHSRKLCAILLAFALWIIFWKITIPVAAIEIAKAILKRETKSKVLVWFIAFIIFTLAQAAVFIPSVGGLIKGIVSLYGFGFIYRKLFKREKNNKIEVEIVEE